MRGTSVGSLCVVASAIIAWNIWYVNHHVSGLLGESKLWPVVLIVVESGAVYAFAVCMRMQADG